MRSLIFAVAALAATVVASPFERHVVHEKRHAAPPQWRKRTTSPRSDVVLPMKIALTQRNLDRGYELLDDVSNPASANYGNHWSAKDVAEMFAPSSESIDSVKTWLAEAGISADRLQLSQGRNWLNFDATVKEAESLLKTKYRVYTHDISGQPHVACSEYSVPEHIQKHVDFITPTVHFDAKILTRDSNRDKAMSKRQAQPGVAKSVGQPGSGSLPKLGETFLSNNSIIKELEQCDTQITPDCLRVLYEFAPNFEAVPGNSFGIVEYTPQAYVASDLDMFFANFSMRQIGNRPKLDSIDGGVVQTTNRSFDFNGESDLDLEYGMTLVYPQQVTLYQAGDLVEGASFNNFLDAIDGSYCTFEGGDDPTQDAVYPDPYGGYEGPENCGGFAATKVISTSYAYNEADLTPFYEERQCSEYMKLGMMGTTVLYSSGDYGVAGNEGQCIGANGTYNNGTSGRFNPSFPGTCPYITSVGATQVKPGVNILEALATGTQPEEACETVIFSGGGFSNVFPMPSYQSAAVKEYFANHLPPYGPDRYNNSQMTRGFPDMSANGANYVIAIDGEFGLVYGTSASTPVFGSIVTLLNQARLQVGKSSVGFINPTIYANPGVFNDITQGGNMGCGTPGFEAVPGWDPVTGLGTPNFPKLLKLYLSLP